MFQSKRFIEKNTPAYAKSRFQFLQQLVTEYQESSDTEVRKTAVAHLANFAYDPINHRWLVQLNATDLFLDIVAETEDNELRQFALGGLCNIAIDPEAQHLIATGDGIPLIASTLSSGSPDIVLTAMTTLYLLINPSTKPYILTSGIKAYLTSAVQSANPRISNLAGAILELV
ncbi:armadillo-type protein [Polychytrium aggregatum]|uniref:armadillo-type protein n=1 Tax=Polychytrium aggregatum TaxID=110093 RepID=UPI0022FECDDB|nr:armadillo-type protein [Polychytrium aggregatum]KAI9208901.1 armadillo-type protein [Polychytrium aggregatum]